MSPYTLEPVERGQAYTNTSGTGSVGVKVRAIVRNENRTVVEKRGVLLYTDNIADAPAFVLNVYKEWDGRGELQYCIITDEVIVNRVIDIWKAI